RNRIPSQATEVHRERTGTCVVAVIDSAAGKGGCVAGNRDLGQRCDIGAGARATVARCVVVQSAAYLACDWVGLGSGSVRPRLITPDEGALINQQVDRVPDATAKTCRLVARDGAAVNDGLPTAAYVAEGKDTAADAFAGAVHLRGFVIQDLGVGQRRA